LHLAASGGLPRSCGLLLGAAKLREGSLELRSLRGLTPLHAAAQRGHAEVCRLLLAARADAAAVTPQGRVPLHLAAMEGHAAVVARLLEARPEALRALDMEGHCAMDLAGERGQRDTAQLLSSECDAQARLRAKWRAHFEPPCRALLNAPACEAFLEIGRPRVLGVEHAALRIACRVVDVLGLVESYSAELCAAGCGSARVLYARCEEQRAIDDVELLLPRHQCGAPVWEHGQECCLRVVGVLAPEPTARAGLACRSACSAWTPPLCIPSAGR